MIVARELETLQSFDSRGRMTLSAYLPLENSDDPESLTREFVRQVEARLEECRPKPECREAIKEDVEIVKMYLRTNGHEPHRGMALFSCAAELFWRAYPLSTPIPAQVVVAPRFHVAPLRELVREPA